MSLASVDTHVLVQVVELKGEWLVSNIHKTRGLILLTTKILVPYRELEQVQNFRRQSAQQGNHI